jgi:hypothetical protein
VGYFAEKSGDLSETQEILRTQQTPLGMLPTNQGLGPNHFAGRDFDLRLVVTDELIGLGSQAELLGQDKPIRLAVEAVGLRYRIRHAGPSGASQGRARMAQSGDVSGGTGVQFINGRLEIQRRS